ncbi:MAG: Gfo/Idh/MocA family oxidoreductase [Rhizobiaceae bacterium]|nr:Gfo/Idh/MocA family oxidoreductase [Rhizobiaceae bacterium]
MTKDKPRFGLVGTGVWARMLHAPMAAKSDEIAFTSIYGRNKLAAGELAGAHQLEAFADFEKFLDSVDIVAFSLTPDAQPHFALAAADAGKHLLLEKPVATDPAVADEIADRLERNNLASIVFFTSIFVPRVRQWVDDATATGGWISGRVESFVRALNDPTNPFYGTDWRRSAGALWDVAPHSVAMLCLTLGKVRHVSATRGQGLLVVLTLTHESGAISQVSATLDAPAALPGSTVLFGSAGANTLPPSQDFFGEANDAYLNAISALVGAAKGSSAENRLDARFGSHVTAVLAAAERSIDTGQRISL